MARDPKTLRYAETHEWVDVATSGDGKMATVGISKFAIDQLNDLVYMDLPEVGRTLEAGEEFGEVESVKAVSPVYSPVAGEIVEVHADLPDKLDSLGDDPYDLGWLIKLKMTGEVPGHLMDHATYEKQCAQSG